MKEAGALDSPSTPQAPAFETAAASSGPARAPIPTEKIGYAMPICLQSAVASIASSVSKPSDTPGIVSTRTRDGCIPPTIVTNTTRPEPEPDRDQVTQAVSVGLCMALAGVLIVLAIV
jgi:hypothetical protein